MLNVPIITINRIRVSFDPTRTQPSSAFGGRRFVRVPLRGLFEALGFDVRWEPNYEYGDERVRAVIVTRGQNGLVFMIDRNRFIRIVNNQPVLPLLLLGGMAELVNNTTMIPLVAPLEALGYTVSTIRYIGGREAINIDVNNQHPIEITAIRNFNLIRGNRPSYHNGTRIEPMIRRGDKLVSTVPKIVTSDGHSCYDFIQVNVPNRPGETGWALVKNWDTNVEYLQAGMGIDVGAQATITATVDPANGGRIRLQSASSGVIEPFTSRQFIPGESINIQAIPNDGWAVNDWSLNGQTLPLNVQHIFPAQNSNVVLNLRESGNGTPQDYNQMDRRALAQEIINRYQGISETGRFIDLAAWASNMTNANRRSVFANLEDTANGLQATTRDFLSNGVTQVPNTFLSDDLLRAILHINDRWDGIVINAIAGGDHTQNLRDEHYIGRAADLRLRGEGMMGYRSTGGRNVTASVSKLTVLDYLENDRSFKTQRNSDGQSRNPRYIGAEAGTFHIEIWGRNS